MLLLLYIDTHKQVNSEGETMRPKSGALTCCRLLSKLKNSDNVVVVTATELRACCLCLHLADKQTKKPAT